MKNYAYKNKNYSWQSSIKSELRRTNKITSKQSEFILVRRDVKTNANVEKARSNVVCVGGIAKTTDANWYISGLRSLFFSQYSNTDDDKGISTPRKSRRISLILLSLFSSDGMTRGEVEWESLHACKNSCKFWSESSHHCQHRLIRLYLNSYQPHNEVISFSYKDLQGDW